ncbi:MAG: DUF4232 domain-containing protein [Gaiellaceae bacterium]
MSLQAGRRTAAGLLLAAVGLITAGCLGGATKTVTVVRTHAVTTTRTATTTSTAHLSACTHDQLAGMFAEAPGSAAAGQIEYVLTLKDTSASGCWLAATPPIVKLLDASGSPLPTREVPGQDVTQSTPSVTLEPGTSATETVRFSPDVPGPGDSQNGPCQPKAHTLAVTLAGDGTVDVPIRPPTSVCERGTLAFDPLKS